MRNEADNLTSLKDYHLVLHLWDSEFEVSGFLDVLDWSHLLSFTTASSRPFALLRTCRA